MKSMPTMHMAVQTALSSAGRIQGTKRRWRVEDVDIDWESLSKEDAEMLRYGLEPANFNYPLTHCVLVRKHTRSEKKAFCEEPECADCALFEDEHGDVMWICCVCREKGIVNQEGTRILFEVVNGYFAAGHCAVCEDWSIVMVPIHLEVQDEVHEPI